MSIDRIPGRRHRAGRSPHSPGKRVSVAALAAGVITMGTTACIGATGGPVHHSVAAERAIPLTVDNRAAFSPHIYVVRPGGTRIALGRVRMGEVRILYVPAELAAGGELQLLAVSSGAWTGFRSEPVVVTAWDRLEWRLEHSPSETRFPSVLRVMPR